MSGYLSFWQIIIFTKENKKKLCQWSNLGWTSRPPVSSNKQSQQHQCGCGHQQINSTQVVSPSKEQPAPQQHQQLQERGRSRHQSSRRTTNSSNKLQQQQQQQLLNNNNSLQLISRDQYVSRSKSRARLEDAINNGLMTVWPGKAGIWLPQWVAFPRNNLIRCFWSFWRSFWTIGIKLITRR